MPNTSAEIEFRNCLTHLINSAFNQSKQISAPKLADFSFAHNGINVLRSTLAWPALKPNCQIEFSIKLEARIYLLIRF